MRGSLLLDPVDHLDGNVEAELLRAVPPASAVVLLGGTSALGPATADRIHQLGNDVERIARRDRYATALANADRIAGIGPVSDAIVTTDQGFPHAFAARLAAAARRGVLLMTTADSPHRETVEWLAARLDVHSTAAGGLPRAFPHLALLVGAYRFVTVSPSGTNARGRLSPSGRR